MSQSKYRDPGEMSIKEHFQFLADSSLYDHHSLMDMVEMCNKDGQEYFRISFFKDAIIRYREHIYFTMINICIKHCNDGEANWDEERVYE